MGAACCCCKEGEHDSPLYTSYSSDASSGFAPYSPTDGKPRAAHGTDQMIVTRGETSASGRTTASSSMTSMTSRRVSSQGLTPIKRSPADGFSQNRPHPNSSAAVALREYTLIAFLGRGTFAEVTLARHRVSEQLFAVKKISKARVHELGYAEQTATERALLGALHHPFLVRLQQAFQNSDSLYLVLDYAPGGDMFHFLRDFKLKNRFRAQMSSPSDSGIVTPSGQATREPSGIRSAADCPLTPTRHALDASPVTPTKGGQRLQQLLPSDIFFYAVEISMVLIYLHEEGFVYRDLKPENILIARSGHVLLTDFGVARTFSKDELAARRLLKKKAAVHLQALEEEEAVVARAVREASPPSAPPGASDYHTVLAAWAAQKERGALCPDTLHTICEAVASGAHGIEDGVGRRDSTLVRLAEKGKAPSAHVASPAGMEGGTDTHFDARKTVVLHDVSSGDEGWDECVTAPGAAPSSPPRPTVLVPEGAERVANDFAGTANYMSPEMVRGEPSGVQHDWWSLGCLLFEMVNGRVAFEGPSEMRLFQNIIARSVTTGPDDFVVRDTPLLPPEHLAGERRAMALLRDLILNGLLNPNQHERLGADTVFAHPFFADPHILARYRMSVVPHIGDLASAAGHACATSYALGKHAAVLSPDTAGRPCERPRPLTCRLHFLLLRTFRRYFFDLTMQRMWAMAAAEARQAPGGATVISLSTVGDEHSQNTSFARGNESFVQDIISGANSSAGRARDDARPYIVAPYTPVLRLADDLRHFPAAVPAGNDRPAVPLTEMSMRPRDPTADDLFADFGMDEAPEAPLVTSHAPLPPPQTRRVMSEDDDDGAVPSFDRTRAFAGVDYEEAAKGMSQRSYGSQGSTHADPTAYAMLHGALLPPQRRPAPKPSQSQSHYVGFTFDNRAGHSFLSM